VGKKKTGKPGTVRRNVEIFVKMWLQKVSDTKNVCSIRCFSVSGGAHILFSGGLFESKQIRSLWNEADQKWYFAVVDVVEALTDSTDPKQYIKKVTVHVTTRQQITFRLRTKRYRCE
jgi:hypothetical protein